MNKTLIKTIHCDKGALYNIVTSYGCNDEGSGMSYEYDDGVLEIYRDDDNA